MTRENKERIINCLHKAQNAAQFSQDIVASNASPSQAMASAFLGWQALRDAIELLVVESVRAGELTQQQVEDALKNLHGEPPTDRAAEKS